MRIGLYGGLVLALMFLAAAGTGVLACLGVAFGVMAAFIVLGSIAID